MGENDWSTHDDTKTVMGAIVGISKPVTTPIIGNVVRSRYEIMFCILMVNSTKKGLCT